MTPILEAIDRAGGQNELAAALAVHPSFVSQIATGRKPIPARHCARIERLTGVRCEQLRPDLVWTRDEAGQVTDYRVPVVDRSH
jgi:DNA-binding transcriptional regulator YdaS (Cro superfamily)